MLPSLSVITATYNCVSLVQRLAKSLQSQTCKEFHWIVVDGASTDGTREFLLAFSADNPWCSFQSEPDFGIYDALNKGIVSLKTPYYVVAGADDQFSADAIERYRAIVCGGTAPDVVLARVMIAGRVHGGFHPHRAWLGHQKVFGGSHSVGMLIRSDLHRKIGRYSNRFPMLADGYFLKRALGHSEVRFMQADFVAGEFALGGLSSSGKLQSLAEGWQIQMLTERFKLLQVMLFVVKLCLRLPALLKPHA